jgi:hypothetical protein
MYQLNAENLGRLMSDVYQDLDVEKVRLHEAKSKYKELGDWLKLDSQSYFKTDSNLYIQGSALLGTLVKPVSDGEYDFDFVYRRELQKESVTQADLKRQVGDQLRRFTKHLKESGSKDVPELHEGARCWRLQYKGRFHMDILPSIPDPKPEYRLLPEHGLIITDRDLVHWQFTNPKGYNAWFRQTMRIALTEARSSLAKASNVNVEAIPEDDIKTTLQMAVQILKRHRDSVYEGHKDDRPISIIISTLAAKSYNNSGNLYLALRNIVENMAKHIEDRDGELWVENPINHKENFADKWNKYHIRAKNFMNWLRQAREEFTSMQNETDTVRLTEQLSKSFRINNASMIVTAAQKRAGLSAAVNAVRVPSDPWSCLG